MQTNTSLRELRVDQVGSLLRPQALLEARAAWRKGQLSDAALTQLEDESILEALAGQTAAHQQVYVDGEFRRTGFMTGFTESVKGFEQDNQAQTVWKGGTGSEAVSPNTHLCVAARLQQVKRIAQNEATFLTKHSPGPFKIALPSPVNFALQFWRKGLSDKAYPSATEFLADAANILAGEAQALAREGVPYIQIDSPSYTHWVDPALKAKYSRAGYDMDRFFETAIAADNAVLDRAAPATTGVHLCRGNSIGRWLAEGAYDDIAEKLFNELRCDRFLLEYDSSRSGDFNPLRYVPRGKIVVLGLITTKTGALESQDEIMRRIDEATRYLPLDQLALSPQCGFASSGRGNPLTLEQQWAKLELVSAVAEKVWKN